VPTEPRLADDAPVPSIRTPRLELVSMTIPFMQALVDDDLTAAAREIEAELPDDVTEDLADFLRYRMAQLGVDPSIRVWLGRAMVLTHDDGRREVIGTLGFHGPPDEEGRLEVGYRVQAPYRREGYAREAVRALFDWANREHGITRFIASISPTNEPSLNLTRSFGFVRTGEHMDEIDGLEHVFEADWPPA
jgi:RimJ/RimL family protein N-acetyltransferase